MKTIVQLNIFVETRIFWGGFSDRYILQTAFASNIIFYKSINVFTVNLKKNECILAEIMYNFFSTKIILIRNF